MSDEQKPERNLDVLERFRTPPIEGLQEVAEMMPSIGWVVHEVVRTTETQPLVWAWCKVGVDAPRYTEVEFTEPDGFTSAPAPTGKLRLGVVLFKLWC